MRLVLLRERADDSSAKGVAWPLAALLAVVALAASAAAGAWFQSSVMRPAVIIDSPEQRVLYEQMARDANYIRGNVNVLAEKVGSLQAKVFEMSALGRRVAEAAGVSYTDPEVQAALDETALLPIMDELGSVRTASVGQAQSESAEDLGRRLDMLTQQVSRQADWFNMLDLVLTRRAGVEASLPTLMPVSYPYASSSFGWRRHPVTGRHLMHEGVDFPAPVGTPIHAASGGVVTVARSMAGYGRMVEISHGNGLVTRYAHASKIKVKEGDLVEKGQLIALVGSTGQSTGPHLHFEVRMAGHPLDPTLFLSAPEPSSTMVAQASTEVDAGLPQVR